MKIENPGEKPDITQGEGRGPSSLLEQSTSQTHKQIDDVNTQMEPLTNLYNRLDAKKTELDGFRPLSPEKAENLKQLFDVDLTYHSNALEGSTISHLETKLILREGLTVKGKPMREHLEVVNHKEALDYLEEIVGKAPHEIGVMEIRHIHYLILKTIDPKAAGQWREVKVFIRRREKEPLHFCEPWEVPIQMDDFMKWLQTPSQEHPVQLAADAHFKLVSIHPFVDGNGRTSRLLMNLILMQKGFPPAVIHVEDRDRYIEALEAGQGGQNLEPFHRLVAEATERSLDLYLETLKDNILWK